MGSAFFEKTPHSIYVVSLLKFNFLNHSAPKVSPAFSRGFGSSISIPL